MKKHLGNKGYSLVEILVVIALIAVGLSLFTASIVAAYSNNVRQVASDIDALISKGKVASTYRVPIIYIVIRDDGTDIIGEYFENAQEGTPGSPGVLMETRIIGSNSINVIMTESGTTVNLPIMIGFERGTGRMFKVEQTGGDFTVVPFTDANPQIIASNTAGTRYIVDLIPFTGKNEVRRG